MPSKTAIIIGITGQDGAYLAKLLLQKSYHVVGITRDILDYKSENLEYLQIEKDITLLELSCLDKERMIKVLNKLKPDEVYNLSAQSSVSFSFSDPSSTISYNILSVLNWLVAIKSVDYPIKFYQASSSEMFGNVGISDLPLKESLLFHPASPYGVSKAAAHWLVVNYRESNKLFAACGILFNHESPLRGENYVVKKVINTAIKISMKLHNAPLSMGNLSVQRDWGYAPDYVHAMWLMLQQNVAGDFLICSGNVMSLQNLVEKVFDNLNLPLEKYLQHDISLLRPTDLEIIYGDNTKAKSILGWHYEMTNDALIEKLIIEETKYIEWQLKRK